MVRVVLCGTYPTQYNGYSKVVYELAKELATFPDVQLHIFGFQNYYDKGDHEKERALPDNVEVYDAFKHEEPKNKGFGETLIADFVQKRQPDVVIVYNDLMVLTTFLERLSSVPDRRFKIIPYVDIVYQNERNQLVDFVRQKSDAGIFFTSYWRDCLLKQGWNKPAYVLEHGFHRDHYFPIPKRVARDYLGISQSEFLFINLNRNQPRKRWDLCMMAFVRFISDHMGEPVRLLVGTAIQGAWDLGDILVSECRKYGLNPQDVQTKHLIFLNNPQMLTDKDVNILYNAADVGINTCDGEGFGLCNFEQAGVGIPQIVPRIGGFRDFFNDKNALLIDPKYQMYIDSTRDGVGGMSEVCDVEDIVSAMNLYYADEHLRDEHGAAAREAIAKNPKYRWASLAAVLRGILLENAAPSVTPAPAQDDAVDVRTLLANTAPAAVATPVASAVATPVASAVATPTPVTTHAKSSVGAFQVVEGSAPASTPSPSPVHEAGKKKDPQSGEDGSSSFVATGADSVRVSDGTAAPAAAAAATTQGPAASGATGQENRAPVEAQSEVSDSDSDIDFEYLEKMNRKITKLLQKKRAEKK